MDPARQPRTARRGGTSRLRRPPASPAEIVEAVPDAVKAKTLDGTLTYWNPAGERLYGYTAAEALGHSAALLFPPERADELADVLARVGRGETVEPYETERLRKDGRRVPVSVSVAPIRNADGAVVGAATIARALIAAEERFLWLVEAAPDGIVLVDGAGRIMLANAQTERLFGYRREELVGQPVELLVPEAARDRHRGHRDTYAAAPHTRPMGLGLALRGRRKDGSTFPVEISLSAPEAAGGAVTIATVRDTTAHDAVREQADVHVRLNAELRALADAERVARERVALLQALAAALAVARSPAEIGAAVVREGLAALGATGGAVLALAHDGAALDLLAAQGYAPELVAWMRRLDAAAPAALAAAARTGAAVWLATPESIDAGLPWPAPLAAASGARSHAVLPLVADGRVRGVLALSFAEPRSFGEEERSSLEAAAQLCAQALDRAALHEAERAARAAAEAAVRARDEFVAVAAHDLRTPLTALRGQAQMLQRLLDRPDGPDPERLRAAAAGIEVETRRLNDLVGRLLDVARLERGAFALERSPTDVAELVGRLTAMLRAAHPESELVLRAPASVMAVVDALRVEQVVANLVDNALRHAPAGTPLEVEVDAPDAATLRIAVRDRGPGVPPPERARIFQRFYRGAEERRAAGLGLGLYISQAIVAQHGGTIEVDAPDGVGARFVVRLPRGPA